MDPREYARIWKLGDWSVDSHGRLAEYIGGLGPSMFQYAPLDGRGLEVPASGSDCSLQSCRSFSSQGLDDAEFVGMLGALVPTSAGMTYGSAGALYPVHSFLLRPREVRTELWYLDANGSRLALIQEVDEREVSAVLIEDWAWPVGALAVLVIDFRRITDKYGFRGLRFALIEAGQVAQMLRENARRIGLQSCVVGGFADEPLLRMLRLSADWFGVAIVVAIGHGR